MASKPRTGAAVMSTLRQDMLQQWSDRFPFHRRNETGGCDIATYLTIFAMALVWCIGVALFVTRHKWS